MKKDDYIGLKIESDLKFEAEHLALLLDRTLSSYVTQAIREKNKREQEKYRLELIETNKQLEQLKRA